MVIKLQSFDKGGKAEGPALIVFDNHLALSDITREANGGVTIRLNQEDEFGNSTKVEITIDQFDLNDIEHA